MNILEIIRCKIKLFQPFATGQRGQGALEYLIFLAVLSAMMVVAGPFFSQIRTGADDLFRNGVARIMDPNP